MFKFFLILIMEYFIPRVVLFERTFCDILKLRLINKNFRNIINFYFLKNDSFKRLFPRRTFIQIGNCWRCDASGNDVVQTLWSMDDPPRRTIVVCNRYECVKSALYSKLKELIDDDHFIYFYPPLEDVEYKIPRTDPTVKTKGTIVRGYCDGAILRNDRFYIYVHWYTNGEEFRKIVLFRQFIEYNNLNKKFCIRPFYETSNLLEIGDNQFP
jgi:hypothetical protein